MYKIERYLKFLLNDLIGTDVALKIPVKLPVWIIELKELRMITMTAVVKVRPEKREEFLQAMRSLTSDRKKQEGLKKITLYQEIDDQTACSLIYEWDAQEDLDRYLGTEEFRVLLGALEVLAEKSEIRYGKIFENLPDLTGGPYEQCSEVKTGTG